MRSDLGKCVIERERSGSSNPTLKVRQAGKLRLNGDVEDYDYDGPMRIPNSIQKMHAINQKLSEKGFTDVLGPLRGYLTNNVGQHWDKIYSEIAANLGRFSWSLQHIIRFHLNVETNTYKGVDGEIYAENKHGNICLTKNNGRYYRGDFYVHPLSRCLCKTKETRYKYVKPVTQWETDRVNINGDNWFVKLDEVWYIGTYRKRTDSLHDLIGSKDWPHSRGEVFTKTKQASKKELKQLREIGK